MLRKTSVAVAAMIGLSAATLAAQDAPTSVLGNWELSVESPQGPAVMTVTFEEVDGQVKGHGESQYGDFQVAWSSVTGTAWQFAVSMEVEGQAFELPFTGTLKEDGTAEGTIEIDMGEPLEMAWTGKRVP